MLLKAQAPISHPVPLSFLSEGHPFPRLHLWLLGHNPNDYPHSSSSIHSKCSTLPYSLHCIPPNLKKTPNSLLFQMFRFGISIFFFFCPPERNLTSTVDSSLPPHQYPICHSILANLPSESLQLISFSPFWGWHHSCIASHLLCCSSFLPYHISDSIISTLSSILHVNT